MPKKNNPGVALEQSAAEQAAASKLVKVFTPNPHFAGVRLGVNFRLGQAECNQATAQKLVADLRYSLKPFDTVGSTGSPQAGSPQGGDK